MAVLSDTLNREYRAQAAGAVCLFGGIVGLILGLKYLVLLAFAGCLLCSWWASGSTIVWLIGEAITLAAAVAVTWGIVFGLNYFAVTNHASVYLRWEPIAQVAVAYLIWHLASYLLSSLGWLDRYAATILGDSDWAAKERQSLEKHLGAN
jgi:hypothetical protein